MTILLAPIHLSLEHIVSTCVNVLIIKTYIIKNKTELNLETK